jgi:cobalt-zinc-cadmium efflux system membrane fusion protein
MSQATHRLSPEPPGRLGRLSRLLASLLAALFVALTATACADNEASANEAAPPPPELPYFEEGVIRVPPKFAERIGLRTETSTVKDIAPVVHVTGVLEFDEQRIAAVGSRISGRIKEVSVIEGTKVKAGDLLATLDSAELGKAQSDISAIMARATFARMDVDRKEELLKQGITSKRALDLARQESSVAEAELRAATQRVQALGGGGKGKNLGVTGFVSPIEGDVVKVHVFRGQAVEPSYTAFTIADRSTLWVRLSVFEGDVGNIRVDDTVEISSQVNPEVLTGKVTYISTVLDPVTRSAEVRVIVPNEAGTLRVGQAVNAKIHPSASSKRAIAVPRSAVVQVDGKPTVFIAVDDSGVVPRPVELGIQGSDLVEIKSGLAEGDRVVVGEAVFALKSELFR